MDLTLKVMLGRLIEPSKRPRAPLCDATEGPPVLMSNDELAVFVFSSFATGGGRAVIKEFVYKDISLPEILVTGAGELADITIKTKQEAPSSPSGIGPKALTSQ